MRLTNQSSARSLLAISMTFVMAMLSSGCSTNQLHTTTEALAISLDSHALKASGIAFITPTSITGEEEDKQSLALAFTEALKLSRPGLRILPLPETLGATNRAGLAGEYRQMFEDYVCREFSAERLCKKFPM